MDGIRPRLITILGGVVLTTLLLATWAGSAVRTLPIPDFAPRLNVTEVDAAITRAVTIAEVRLAALEFQLLDVQTRSARIAAERQLAAFDRDRQELRDWLAAAHVELLRMVDPADRARLIGVLEHADRLLERPARTMLEPGCPSPSDRRGAIAKLAELKRQKAELEQRIRIARKRAQP